VRSWKRVGRRLEKSARFWKKIGWKRVRDFGRRYKTPRLKIWAIFLSLLRSIQGDRSFVCLVEAAAATTTRLKLLLQVDVARSKVLLKSYHLQEGLRVDLVWRKYLSRSRVLDYLEKLLKEELLTRFSPT